MNLTPITFLFALLLFVNGCATTVSMNIKESVAVGRLNPVIYYTGYSGALSREQVVLFVRGTGRFPASRDFGMGAEAVLIGFSVVYPQKSYVNDEKQYYLHDHRGQRLHDLCAISDDLIAQGTKRILLLADSEGTMLAPEIAARYSRYVCGLVCMGGSVTTFEEDIRFCNANGRGIFGQSQVQEKLDDIAKEPDNARKDFCGHSYKFWSSYLRYDPVLDLKSLACPVLYLNGENDDLDLAKQRQRIQQLSDGGLNIGQKIYRGVGHELKKVAKSMARDILEWAEKNHIGSRDKQRM